MENRNVCFLCDGELKPRWGYLVCEECQIVAPAVGDMIDKREINDKMAAMRDLRAELSSYLSALEQKYMSGTATDLEKTERELWNNHNRLHLDLEHYLPAYSNKDIRQEKVYPLFYQYLLVSEEIEEFYSKQ